MDKENIPPNPAILSEFADTATNTPTTTTITTNAIANQYHETLVTILKSCDHDFCTACGACVVMTNMSTDRCVLTPFLLKEDDTFLDIQERITGSDETNLFESLCNTSSTARNEDLILVMTCDGPMLLDVNTMVEATSFTKLSEAVLHVKPPAVLLSGSQTGFHILGTCQGAVGFFSGKTIVIWNPSTSDSHAVISSPISSLIVKGYIYCEAKGVPQLILTEGARTWHYCFGHGWGKALEHPDIGNLDPKRGVLHGDNVIWIKGLQLLSYNLFKKTYETIKLPGIEKAEAFEDSSSLCLYKGSLILSYHNIGDSQLEMFFVEGEKLDPLMTISHEPNSVMRPIVLTKEMLITSCLCNGWKLRLFGQSFGELAVGLAPFADLISLQKTGFIPKL